MYFSPLAHIQRFFQKKGNCPIHQPNRRLSAKSYTEQN